MQLESSMEKARRILDSDCRLYESISHAYWVRSQSNTHKEYLIICHCTNFITRNCPWYFSGNISKHAIKLYWLHSSLMDSKPLLDLQTTPNTLNAPSEISTHAPNLHSNTITTNMEYDTIEELNLLREELFGYLLKIGRAHV